MKVKNGIYKEVAIRWDAMSLPVKAGTPCNAYGVEANDATAIGIVPQDITKRPLMDRILVLVGGTVSLQEVEASYGDALSAAAKESMYSITFAGDKPIEPPVVEQNTVIITVDAYMEISEGEGQVVYKPASMTAGEIGIAFADGKLPVVVLRMYTDETCEELLRGTAAMLSNIAFAEGAVDGSVEFTTAEAVTISIDADGAVS